MTARSDAERQRQYRENRRRGLPPDPSKQRAPSGCRPSGGQQRPDQLLEAFLAAMSTPDLPGAACRGLGDLFSPAEDVDDSAEAIEDRQDRAKAVCRRCPELVRCTDWVDATPAKKRPIGVLAGQTKFRSKPRTEVGKSL